MTAQAPACFTSLRALAEARGLLVGAAVDLNPLVNETRYAYTLAREFNFLTTGSALKWGPVHPDPDYWNFAPADTIIKFASDHQMSVKGHTLIWHNELPWWVNSQMSVDQLRQAMREHIQTLVGRYKGKLYAWDVVNEVITSEGFRDTLFFDKLGAGYIAEAFRYAHEADPDTLLVYNEDGPYGYHGKWDRVYDFVRKLVADNVPIHGVGIQMHLDATNLATPDEVAANVRRFASLGLKVNISEMDVALGNVAGDLTERLQLQRRIYHDMIVACCKEKGFVAVTFWGFTDAHSWKNKPGTPDAPLLFNEDYQPKPAYWGVLNALLDI